MAYKTVELTGRKDYFHIQGNSVLIVDRTDGHSSGKLHELKVEIYIPRKYIERFEISEQQHPALLYLHWRERNGDKKRSLVGKIRDISQIRKFVKEINVVYQSRRQ